MNVMDFNSVDKNVFGLLSAVKKDFVHQSVAKNMMDELRIRLKPNRGQLYRGTSNENN